MRCFIPVFRTMFHTCIQNGFSQICSKLRNLVIIRIGRQSLVLIDEETKKPREQKRAGPSACRTGTENTAFANASPSRREARLRIHAACPGTSGHTEFSPSSERPATAAERAPRSAGGRRGTAPRRTRGAGVLAGAFVPSPRGRSFEVLSR